MMLAALMRASIEGAVFVAVIWGLTRALRALSPAARAIVWWAAAAKFVIALICVTPIVLPVLPNTYLLPAAPLVAVATRAITLPIAASPDRPSTNPAPVAIGSWPTILIVVWVLGLIVIAGVGVLRWHRLRRIVARSAPCAQDVQTCASELASRFQVHRVPSVRLSADIDAPLVVGLLRPTILLPSTRFDALTVRQWEMVLGHELAHVKRADLWLGCVPALAERLFFFHPFAHLAAREYALWREAACDASVLSTLEAAPQAYGRLLLDLGVSRRPTGLVAAGTAWSFSSLKRRIAMLHLRPLWRSALVFSLWPPSASP